MDIQCVAPTIQDNCTLMLAMTGLHTRFGAEVCRLCALVCIVLFLFVSGLGEMSTHPYVFLRALCPCLTSPLVRRESVCLCIARCLRQSTALALVLGF